MTEPSPLPANRWRIAHWLTVVAIAAVTCFVFRVVLTAHDPKERSAVFVAFFVSLPLLSGLALVRVLRTPIEADDRRERLLVWFILTGAAFGMLVLTCVWSGAVDRRVH